MNNAFNMSKKLTSFGKRFYSKGQGMTEYLIILGLIAIAAITVFSLYGKTLRAQVSGMAAELSGGNNSEALTKANDAAVKAVAEGEKEKKMKTYGNQ